MRYRLVVPGIAYDVPMKEGDHVMNVSEEGELVDTTNQLRVENGLKPLVRNQKLTAAAEANARIIAQHLDEYEAGIKLDLHNLDGTTLGSRLDAVDYHGNGASENVGLGLSGISSPDVIISEEQRVKELMDGFLKSPPHKVNMLKSQDKDIGIGCIDVIKRFSKNPKQLIEYYICVQDFGGGE
jgi:uncharacterized protein YkwD